MADSIRMAKIMKGMTGAGAGKAVTDEDIANNRRMMAERGMSDMESQNATTDMDAEKAGMIEKLMQMLSAGASGSMAKRGARRLGEAAKTMSDADRERSKEMMGRKGMMGGGMVKKYKGGGSVKKYKGGGCVMPGRGKSRAMNK